MKSKKTFVQRGTKHGFGLYDQFPLWISMQPTIDFHITVVSSVQIAHEVQKTVMKWIKKTFHFPLKTKPTILTF